jgi:hypothetical protein
MGIYTTAQIRSAILRAADRIEGGAPYDFNGQGVTSIAPYGGCAPCMWGHIGLALGLRADTNSDIAYAVTGTYNTTELYSIGAGSSHNRTVAARKLRAFADLHFPAKPSLDKAYLAFRSTLSQTMEAT